MFESEILTVCPTPVVAVTKELFLVYANDAAKDLFKIEQDGITSQNLLNFLPGLRELDQASFGSPDGGWLLHAASREQLQIDAVSGEKTFPIEVDVRSFRSNDKDVMVVALHDMTDLNGSLNNILRAHQELEEFNRVAIGRELRMVALKEEVNDLLGELNRPRRYTEDD